MEDPKTHTKHLATAGGLSGGKSGPQVEISLLALEQQFGLLLALIFARTIAPRIPAHCLHP
jgi:hypothetical protein